MDLNSFKDSSVSDFEEQDSVQSIFKKNETIQNMSSIDQKEQSINNSDFNITNIFQSIQTQKKEDIKLHNSQVNTYSLNQIQQNEENNEENTKILEDGAINGKEDSLILSKSENQKEIKSSIPSQSSNQNKQQNNILQEEFTITHPNEYNDIQIQNNVILEKKDLVKDDRAGHDQESLIVSQIPNQQSQQNQKDILQKEFTIAQSFEQQNIQNKQNQDLGQNDSLIQSQLYENNQNQTKQQLLAPQFLNQFKQINHKYILQQEESTITSNNEQNIIQIQQYQNQEQASFVKQDFANNIQDTLISSQIYHENIVKINQNSEQLQVIVPQQPTQNIQQIEYMKTLNQPQSKQSQNAPNFIDLQQTKTNDYQNKQVFSELNKQFGTITEQQRNNIEQQNNKYAIINYQVDDGYKASQVSSNPSFPLNPIHTQKGLQILEQQNSISSINTQLNQINLESQKRYESNIILDISSSIKSQKQEDTEIHFSSEDEDNKDQIKFNLLQEQLNDSFTTIQKNQNDNICSQLLDFQQEFQFVENKKHSFLLEQSKTMKDYPNILKKQKKLKQQYVQIEPRDYQEEIFKNVTQNYGNYIIFLETGTGKTLVSQMIAQYTLSKFKESKVVFLANQVNLVEQQYNNFTTYQRSIEEYLVKQNLSNEINQNINIAFYHGKMNLDFWNRSFWQKNIEQSQIIFFSSQIFLNGLRRGHFQLTQFKLIIFDECHNASKEHPFSQIMKEFYFQAKKNDIILKNTPNIIGLSATPITQGNKGNFSVRKEMVKLAHNLDCQFVNYDLQKVYAQLRNIEQTNKYYVVDMHENEYQYIESNNIKGFDNAESVLCQLQEKYPELKELFFQLQLLSRLDNNASKAYTQILRKIINLLEEYLIILIYQIGVYVVQFFIFDILQEFKCINITAPKITCMKEKLEEILLKSYDLFRTKYNNIQKHLSKKSLVLLNILEKNVDISLIFCNSKVVVKYVTKLIQNVFQNNNSDQNCCEYIMGQTSQNQKYEDDKNLKIINNLNSWEIQNLKQQSIEEAFNKIHQETQFNFKFFELKQKYSDQQKIIERFRNKQFKILVSTSVVEEGFDIPSCNVVIAFSKIISQRQYIQMKGRARADNSKFYALVAVCKDNKEKVQNHQLVSEQIKQEYQNLSLMSQEEFKREKELQLWNDEGDQSMENYEQFIIQETNANVNTFWVKEIINQFCQSFCYNNQLLNKFPLVFDSLISERSLYLSLIILPFQLQANIFMNHQKLKNKKEDAQRCAFMQAVKSLLKNKYISNELRPRHQSNKNFYFGRGEDDYYVEYSDKYFAIIQKYMQEVFVGYLNGKKKKIVVYKKLYRQIVDEVFVQKKQIQQNSMHQFCLYDIQYKGKFLEVKLIYNKKCLEHFSHPDIQFFFKEQINLDDEQLNKLRNTNQQAHLKLLNLEKINIQPKKIYTSKSLVYKKTKDQDYKSTEESVLINENVVFLYMINDLNQIQIEQISIINSQIEKIRDFLKLKIISEKISTKIEKEKIDFENMQIECLNVFIKPNYTLTGSFSKKIIKEDQKEIYSIQFENMQTLTEKDLIQILEKKSFEKNIVFLGKHYFKFITSINVFNDNFKTHYDILTSELDMRFNDCFVMSKAVESKFFKYLKIKEYVTLAPCLSIISQKLHTFFADQITLKEKILIKIHQQNPLNYNMAEIRNKQFSEIIYFIIGYVINKNQNIFQNFEKYSTLFQPILKSFNLIEKYSVLTKFINIQLEENQYKADKQNLLEQFSKKYIGYKFNNIGLLQQVFTHSSYKQDMICKDLNKIQEIQEQSIINFINEMQKIEKKSSQIQLNDISNDVLSFIGSIIFSQIVLKQLYSRYSQSNPNELDIFMEIICSEQIKSFMSAQFYLDQKFICGNQYKQIFQKLESTASYLREQCYMSFKNIALNFNNNISTLSQLFDSLVGAIYIDMKQDFEKTSEFFNQHIQQLINNIFQIAGIFPKYSLIQVLNQKGHDWEDIQIIKLPHPEQYIPANQNKYLFQIYDIKNECLLIDKVFECQRIEEAYVAIKKNIINSKSE